ncbi:MAG: formylglycine-generating enzyme family protein, partial [Planctomycetota bacterium]
EFRRYSEATGRNGPPLPDDPDLPVTQVTLEEARAFAAWSEARLPTSAELRYAATSAGFRLYPWGDEFDPRRANTRESGSAGPEAVGSRPLGASAHGVEDLIGNAAEWTETPAEGSGEPALFEVVGRSFRLAGKSAPFVSHRLRADERQSDVGFRLARDLPRLAQ